MDKMIRVLHVVTVMDVGGIETTIMNYMRHLDPTKVKFDFLVHRTTKGYFDDEIKKLGGTIHQAPSFSFKNIPVYSKFVDQFFKDHDYDIVHSHLDSLSYFPLKGAMNNDVKVRIAHSHVNGFDRNITYPIRQVFKKMIPQSATHFMACSQSAGEFMFGTRDFDILLNPIDINKFQFNLEKRNLLRDELNIGDKILIGHVGRFDTAKNHKFILELADALPNDQYHFILLGAGVLKDEIIQSAQDMNISNMTFLGIKDNVYEYLSAMDIFILPSFYEGLGIVAIEAQVSGLPAIISEGVSPSVAITSRVKSVPLNKGEWFDAITSTQLTDRLVMNQAIKEYDVDVNSTKLLHTYSKLVEENQ